MDVVGNVILTDLRKEDALLNADIIHVIYDGGEVEVPGDSFVCGTTGVTLDKRVTGEWTEADVDTWDGDMPIW